MISTWSAYPFFMPFFSQVGFAVSFEKVGVKYLYRLTKERQMRLPDICLLSSSFVAAQWIYLTMTLLYSSTSRDNLTKSCNSFIISLFITDFSFKQKKMRFKATNLILLSLLDINYKTPDKEMKFQSLPLNDKSVGHFIHSLNCFPTFGYSLRCLP